MTAPHRVRPLRTLLGLLLLALAACAPADPAGPATPRPAARLITPALWAGAATATAPLPALDLAGPGRHIRGPLTLADPLTGEALTGYEERSGGGDRIVALTHGGTALGRLVDHPAGLPEKRFHGDVIFPLGHWRDGEARDFEGAELTPLGPAPRHYHLQILAVDGRYRGRPGALDYRLTVRDAAGRVLVCEHSIYLPGEGRVFHTRRGLWDGCTACPCPSAPAS